MGTTTFSGPIKAGSIKNTTGTTVGTNVANVGSATLSQANTVTFGDDGTETVVAYIPADSQIIEVYVDVLTAFDAGTTNTFDVGDGDTVNQFADALDVSSVGRVLGSSDASQLGNYDDIGTSDIPLTITYNQSGSAATAGEALVTVLYVQANNLA